VERSAHNQSRRVRPDWTAVDQDGLSYIVGRFDDSIKTPRRKIGCRRVQIAEAG
jgi:hypothetical protein